MAIRYGVWKVHFIEQRSVGADAWQDPFVPLRFPKLVNLRTDPFEEADLSGQVFYWKWRADHLFVLTPVGALVAQWMQTLAEFPPRQSPESWSPAAMIENLKKKAEALKTGAFPG